MSNSYQNEELEDCRVVKKEESLSFVEVHLVVLTSKEHFNLPIKFDSTAQMR